MIWSSFKLKKPATLSEAMARLCRTPSDSNRIAVYRALRDNFLVLAARTIPSSWQNEPVPLEKATTVAVLTGAAPDGGEALMVFTDTEEAKKRNNQAATFTMKSQDVLKLVLEEGFSVLIINPAGNWVGIPSEDVGKILNGVWAS